MDDDANNVSRQSGLFKSLTRDVQQWKKKHDYLPDEFSK